MTRWIAAWIVALVLAATAAAGEVELDIERILEDKDEVLKTEMEAAEKGDLTEFTVVTDDNVSALEVGDIYKSQTSFFKVSQIHYKGGSGGKFVVQRTAGKLDPGRKWDRVSGLGPPSIRSRETLLQRFLSGGALMYPIAVLLLVTIVITLNSVWVYRRRKQCPPGFIEAARTALGKGDVDQFAGLAIRERGLLAAVCRALVLNFQDSTPEDMQMRGQTAAMQRITLLRTPLKGLNFIAAIAPLLGLLGTVIGMILCFDSLAEEAASAGKSQAMAAGIKVALLTTAAGLSVAVPSLLVFFLFNQKLNLIAAHCEGVATEFVHSLAVIKRNGGRREPPEPAPATAGAGEGQP